MREISLTGVSSEIKWKRTWNIVVDQFHKEVRRSTVSSDRQLFTTTSRRTRSRRSTIGFNSIEKSFKIFWGRNSYKKYQYDQGFYLNDLYVIGSACSTKMFDLFNSNHLLTKAGFSKTLDEVFKIFNFELMVV